ncbi:Uncharacterized protein FKW44_013744 [Caligus rogercresseyi]|uniref:DUF7041 domain-containing protein n=1 Tax=Caligus rogercresseyi TaxID=217165 RepID=A0A7T8GY08_CALRO|nr:Uncharacterized protein FKW44_013744 [Caligus rogercresseyi]
MPEVSDADVAAMAASAVALKLPTFWPSKPAVWFSQIEAQFTLKGITQDVTKHAHLITSLSDDVATRVSDLLISPPETGRYEALKKRLLQTYTLKRRPSRKNPRFWTTGCRPSIRPHGRHARTHPGWRTTRIPLQGDFPSSTPTRDPLPH